MTHTVKGKIVFVKHDYEPETNWKCLGTIPADMYEKALNIFESYRVHFNDPTLVFLLSEETDIEEEVEDTEE